MAWSVIDLSSITDELIALLNEAFDPASLVWTANGGTIDRFDVKVSGAMPETVRADGDCKLSLYLLHVSQDKFYRNTPVPGPFAQTNDRSPLSLDLFYLLTAYAKENYNQEQQAMSIAMRCFHENAIVRKPPAEHYTLSMEVESADEIARLWQALVTPLRLSTVYKVSVVFITPSEEPLLPQPRPTSVALAVAPTGLPGSTLARLYGAAVRESFIVPPGADAGHADAIPYVVAPGLVRPGDNLIVTGAGLDLAAFASVYLSTPDGVTERNITTWRQLPAAPSDLRLHFPKAMGVAPAGSPAPGLYLLSIGSDAPKTRSNTVPVSVAAFIDDAVTPPEFSPHLLTPDGGGVYTVNGLGFTAANTEVLLGTVPLTRVATVPGPGEFRIDAGEASFKFKLPAALPHDRYELRVRVNQIDSPPSWVIEA